MNRVRSCTLRYFECINIEIVALESPTGDLVALGIPHATYGQREVAHPVILLKNVKGCLVFLSELKDVLFLPTN